MKIKILQLAIAVIAVTTISSTQSASAQNAKPRYGTASSQDNTFRNQKLGYRQISDVSGIDTFTLNPNSLVTNYTVTVTDQVVFHCDYRSSYIGDEMNFIISNTSGTGHTVTFSGRGSTPTAWQLGSGGNVLTLTTGKRANIFFIFDGTAWVETSRTIQ